MVQKIFPQLIHASQGTTFLIGTIMLSKDMRTHIHTWGAYTLDLCVCVRVRACVHI